MLWAAPGIFKLYFSDYKNHSVSHSAFYGEFVGIKFYKLYKTPEAN